MVSDYSESSAEQPLDAHQDPNIVSVDSKFQVRISHCFRRLQIVSAALTSIFKRYHFILSDSEMDPDYYKMVSRDSMRLQIIPSCSRDSSFLCETPRSALGNE